MRRNHGVECGSNPGSDSRWPTFITLKLILSNVRFLASFRGLEESPHCTWCESDAIFNRKLKIKWQGLRSALLAYNFCHHMYSYDTGCGASRKWSLTKLWDISWWFTKQHKNFGVPLLILNHEKTLFWTFFLLPMLKYGLIRSIFARIGISDSK